MIYEFLDEHSGETVELSFPSADAPPLGSIIEHEGRSLKRIVSKPPMAGVDGFKPFTSYQLPRQHPDAPSLDARGRAVFQTRQQLKEFMAKSRGTTSELVEE